MLFLIFISFAPIFPFPFVSLLCSCPFHSLFISLLFFRSAFHSIFCSVFCSSSSFEGTWTLDVLLWNPPYHTLLCRLWCLKLRLLWYRCHPLGHAAHPRALEKHHLTLLLCSFTHAGECRHFLYMLEHLARLNRINNYFILFTFSGALFLNSVIVIALFVIAT